MVTGGSRGIGRAIVLRLATVGFDTVINYVNSRDAAESVAAVVESLGGRSCVVGADVSTAAGRETLLATACEQFGRIDVLVNNAGISSPGRADLLDATPDSFDRVIAVNLKAPFFLSQAAARIMVAQSLQHQGGHEQAAGKSSAGMIINIGSVSAWAVSSNRADYCVAKAGVSMMTRIFADRLAAEGILVYEVQPGVIETDMTGSVREKYDTMIAERAWPIARWGQPDDVARAVAMLASGELPFSTGETIRVDGGFHLRRI